MKITSKLLRKHNACKDQVRLFEKLYPDGLWPSVETLTEAAAAGLDVWWACKLLPRQGPGSSVAYALWCAQQVQHLCPQPRVHKCLEMVETELLSPGTHTTEALQAADDAAGRALCGYVYVDAPLAAGHNAVHCVMMCLLDTPYSPYAATYAADAACAAEGATAAASQAQLACLAQLLEEAP